MLREKTQVRDRTIITENDGRRQEARARLFGDVSIARDVLNPSNQFRRWKDRNKAEAQRVAGEVAQTAKNNAPLIGAVGIGALLFAARRPISNWISQLRKAKAEKPEGE